MFDPADATADARAETRAAELERCGLRVEPRYLKFARSQRNRWVYDVVQHGKFLTSFDDDDAAYEYARDILNEGE
jgi:hypothetical protein